MVGVGAGVGVSVVLGTGVAVAVGVEGGSDVGVGGGARVAVGPCPVQARTKANTAKLMSKNSLWVIASQCTTARGTFTNARIGSPGKTRTNILVVLMVVQLPIFRKARKGMLG